MNMMKGLFLLVAAPLAVCGEVKSERIFRPPRDGRGNTGAWVMQPLDTCVWIAHPALLDAAIPPDGRFLRFRRPFESDGTPLELDVSADERYVLFVDGERVGRGPSRGWRENWLYESRKISLAKGPHVLEAAVWALGEKGPNAQLSHRGGSFILKAYGSYDRQLSTTTGNVWQVGAVTTTEMTDRGRSGSFGMGCQARQVGEGHETALPSVWTNAVARAISLKDFFWEGGCRRNEWELYPSTLPDQLETRFTGETFTVPARSKKRFYWDLGVYRCGYPELVVSGGRGASVTWKWAESLVDGEGLKGNRAARDGKHMVGFGDTFVADGRDGARFSPPWWRCGRWCEIAVETGDEPLAVKRMDILETRYPLLDEGAFSTSDASLSDIRSLCLRGLQMCAHEIVMDCPFFEQQMYPGDTRVQLQVQGTVSSDARLRRRAIEIFDRARRSDGYAPMNFPSRAMQDSASFTMCHALMYGDYVKWRGGDAWLKARLPGLAHALASLALLENADGLLTDVPGWRFYDWTVNSGGWWSRGHAGNTEDGPSALDNLFYVFALEAASEAAAACGMADQAALWKGRADRTRRAAAAALWDAAAGLVKDRPNQRGPYSEHAQALGILADVVPAADAARHFQNLISRDDLVRATVYFKYYLFEAFAKRGRGDLILTHLDLWRGYLAKGLTTPVESPDGAIGKFKEARSDCHGWGSHPVYFFATAIAGITPRANAFTRVRVAPSPGPLKHVGAKLPTVRGVVSVDLDFSGKRPVGTVTLPAGTDGEFEWKGERTPLLSGENHLAADTVASSRRAQR